MKNTKNKVQNFMTSNNLTSLEVLRPISLLRFQPIQAIKFQDTVDLFQDGRD